MLPGTQGCNNQLNPVPIQPDINFAMEYLKPMKLYCICLKCYLIYVMNILSSLNQTCILEKAVCVMDISLDISLKHCRRKKNK